MSNLKTKSFHLILRLLTLLLIFSFQVKGQVTIGALSEPQSGALLDLKEREVSNPDADTPNSSKGVLFPKVSLKSATSLEPLFSTTADPQKKTSKGMIVYNVNKNATGLNEGLCVWNGEDWSSVVGGGPSSAAKLDIDCTGKIVVNGTLFKGNMLSPYVNIITLPVVVTQKGSYNIVVNSEPDNQYYFEASGEFFKTGNYNLTLNGKEEPQYSTQERSGVPDKMKIYINGSEYDVAQACPSLTLPELKVGDLPANYYFTCNHVDVSNAKLKMKEASTNAFISVRLQVPQEAAGGKYHIETNTVNGVKFEGNGDLFAGQQTVMLESNGAVPTVPGIYDFHFQCNSTDPRVGNCSVEIPIVGRDIKIAVWGDVSGGNWDIGAPGKGVKLMFESAALFGLGKNDSPFYPVSGINFTRENSIPNSFSDLDILIISYNAIPAGIQVDAIVQFINNGGVVIHCMEGGYTMEVPSRIFGAGVITKGAETGVGISQVNLLPGSPLTNGVYMDIVGRKVGYDGGYNLGFNVQDTSEVEIVGIRESDKLASIIRHKTKPYIMLGDGGIFAGSATSPPTNNNPLLVTIDGLPLVRTDIYYPHGAYNAHLFVNMMIWAIKYRLLVAP
jgi:hypothetical protein